MHILDNTTIQDAMNESIYIDSQKNKVIVCTSKNNITCFNSDAFNSTLHKLDSNMYEIHYGEVKKELTSSLKSGEYITTKKGMNNYPPSTLGFPMKKRVGSSYVYGFVTTAHSFTGSNNNYVYDKPIGLSNPSKIGSLHTISPNNVNGIDAAFVELDSGYTASYEVANDDCTLYNRGYYSAPQNTTVYMCGAKSALQVGTIISTHENSGLAQQSYLFDYSSQSGDSGAPVYANAFGEMTLVAMHRASATMGSNSDGTSNIRAVGVHISDIIDYLDITFDW